ncbi:MAG: peroxidase family protein [Bdellovibrionota bacterium]
MFITFKFFRPLLVLIAGVCLVSCDSRGSGGIGNSISAGEVRSIDGFGNNPQFVEAGSSNSLFLRLTDSEYSDGANSPAGATRPSPRVISNELMITTEGRKNAQNLSNYVWLWGQFLDHDITLTPESKPHEVLQMEIPKGDHYFDPDSTGDKSMSLNRSRYASGTGTEAGNPREQVNLITSWIDASNVYGSDQERADWLRTFQGGKLKTSPGGFLPLNDGSQINAGPAPFSKKMYVAGDVRANEQVALTAMHTLFLREHNRLAEDLAITNPEWNDEQIYQRTKKFIGAFMQSITFNEFLPILLGQYAPRAYQGYKPEVNGSIRNEFSTAVFRFGHSMIPEELLLINPDNSERFVALRDVFFRPGKLEELGMEPVLRGFASQKMEEVDLHVNENLRNFLFGRPGSGGLDLAALNILRGRDHGLPNYNALRSAYGLEPLRHFSEITSNTEIATKLSDLYKDINDVDPWVGLLAEDHLKNLAIGQTLALGLSVQFSQLRDGDRFWYENDSNFSSQDIDFIKRSNLLSIITRNTDITLLKNKNIFVAE